VFSWDFARWEETGKCTFYSLPPRQRGDLWNSPVKPGDIRRLAGWI
jgi:hypothetical protein